MENPLDPASQEESQTVDTVLETLEGDAVRESLTEAEDETTIEPDDTDGSSTLPTTQTKKAYPGKAATKSAHKQEELPPNPLLLDPYDWDKCTVTVGYSLLPDQKVSVSVHNHKDEPIVQEFRVEEVPLPEKILGVMASLQRIWPTSPVHTTVVLLPKVESTLERPIIAAVRVATDTPIVQEGFESNLPFPAPILAMLEQLKALMPERALKNIEKNAKAKTSVATRTTSKLASKPTASASAPAANKNVRQNQMTLF